MSKVGWSVDRVPPHGLCHASGCLQFAPVTRVRQEVPRKPHQAVRAGFTLIELLVVIGVIGILAGLLLPVVSKAMDRGKGSLCLNNLRQMGIATFLYTDDYGHYPPGRWDGVTQWDLCLGTYVGGNQDPRLPEARTALFSCPSAKIRNVGLALNYSGNPNALKEIKENVGPVRKDELRRPAETILVGDAIQYQPDGNAHAILWGLEANLGSSMYWNNGLLEAGSMPIRVGDDLDGERSTMDPGGANFRYRHDKRVTSLFADGHVERIKKGRVLERQIYTNY
jgi:prepilin-type N-terminal cleavage/methylation domain-containing protein/prepilin-type processing-associated H-X9-DG protein